MTTGSTPSGWYDDPSGKPHTLRWWDGSQWTDKLQPAGTGATPAPAATTTSPASTGGPSAQPAAGGGPGPAGAFPAQTGQPAPGFGPAAPAQPFTPTSVVFETVEADSTKRRILLGVGAVALSLVMAGAGYLVGSSTAGKSGKQAGAQQTAGPTGGDPNSPNGFAGTAITGGKPIPGGQKINGQQSKMNFMLPQGWQSQVDAKAPTDVRYAIDPYACVGHGGGACDRGLAIQNLRLLNGGWSDPKSLVLGMGQLLYTAQFGSDPGSPQEPLKQQAVKVQGMDGYLAMWHIPLSSQTSAPDSYCGILEVTPSAGATTVPVLQICLDHSTEAPALAVMDQIANSVTLTP